MAAVGELADLAHPQPVGETAAPFGQPHGHQRAAGKAHRVFAKLLLRPVGAREFVIAQAGDAARFRAPQKLWRVALAIEHQGKAMPPGLRRKERWVRLAGDLAL